MRTVLKFIETPKFSRFCESLIDNFKVFETPLKKGFLANLGILVHIFLYAQTGYK